MSYSHIHKEKRKKVAKKEKRNYDDYNQKCVNPFQDLTNSQLPVTSYQFPVTSY